MKSASLFVLVTLLVATVGIAQTGERLKLSGATFSKAHSFSVSPEVRSFRQPARIKALRSADQMFLGRTLPDLISDQSYEPVWLSSFSSVGSPTASLSFDGISNYDNVARFGLIIAPPDMVGAVGPEHYVQVANSLFQIFDKSGMPLGTPHSISSLFNSLGTTCASRNDGLPNVIYDQFADRWLISQVCTAFPPFRQMIAVSATSDPTRGWYAYEFVMPGVKLNDFPKMAVWPSGYLMSTNEFFGSDFSGNGIFAFDREKMLRGDANAGYVYLSVPAQHPLPTGFLPANVDGLRPPANGESAIFATHMATEYGDSEDALRLFDFSFDFDNPQAAIFEERPESPIAVTPFDPTSSAGRADISQVAPGEKLDAVSDTLMSRLSYRNLGSERSLVANQTVRISNSGDAYRAGVRVYELRTGKSGFEKRTDSTIGENGSSRWIASAAQDHQGNIGVQYNAVSDEKRVAIRFAGSSAVDTPDTFRTESTLIESTGVQKGFGWRWGEYSGMSVDPVDDCSFWVTNAYYTEESQDFSDFGWLTRVGRFKFDECTAAERSLLSGIVTDAITGQPIVDADVSALPFSRRTSRLGKYDNMAMPPGTHELTVSAPGYASLDLNLVIPNGSSIRDFVLQPIPVASVSSTNVSSESCRLNGAPDPGETVTMSIALQNTGVRDAAQLRAVLQTSSDIISVGPEQDFGALPAGSEPVERTFTFTVSSSVNCGRSITLKLHLFDGDESLGEQNISLDTGSKRVVFRESFDRVLSGGLPPRWSRSGESFRTWGVSSNRSVAGPKSLHSPDPLQMGSNSVASPVFRVTSSEARLTFKNWYEFETTFLRNRLYDGSLLEIKIGGDSWQDILAAGGMFESGGYDGVIDACCHNPLGGRLGWSGRSGVNQTPEFVTTEVRLPKSAAGNLIQFRFRVGTDVGTFREGQYIDDLVVTDGSECGCSS